MLMRTVKYSIVSAFLLELFYGSIAAADTPNPGKFKLVDFSFAGVVEPARRLAITNEIDGVIRKIHIVGGENIKVRTVAL